MRGGGGARKCSYHIKLKKRTTAELMNGLWWCGRHGKCNAAVSTLEGFVEYSSRAEQLEKHLKEHDMVCGSDSGVTTT